MTLNKRRVAIATLWGTAVSQRRECCATALELR